MDTQGQWQSQASCQDLQGVSLVSIKMITTNSWSVFLADIPRCEAIYADTDLPGNDIDSVLDVPTSEDCQDLCIQNTACTFYTWVDDSYTINPAIIHKCHLKNGNPGATRVTGLVSGAATC